jgi:predicted glycosyltransferase
MVIYSQDGLGLGHMRRTTSIAHQFLRAHSDASVLTLSDSRVGQFFQPAPNHDYLKLPSIVKFGPSDWRAVNLGLPFSKVRTMRQEVIRSAVLNFWPDIFLVDHMPHGAMGELLLTFEALKAAGANTKIILGLRDILDAPEVIQRRWQFEGAYEALERFYDLILVYGMREVFDLAEHYRFPPYVAERLRYCGYVCTPTLARQAAETRATCLEGASSGAKLIVAMAGGGADAYPMMCAILNALPGIRAQQPCVLVLITGPFMPDHQRNDLQRRANGLPVWVLPEVDDSLSFLEAADLVVAMAGYNTTMEILRSGKPAILIPRAGPSAEQRMRARLFAAKGWVEMADPESLSASQLQRMANELLRSETKAPARTAPNLHGLLVSTDHLLSLLPSTPHETLLADAINMPIPVPALIQAAT